VLGIVWQARVLDQDRAQSTPLPRQETRSDAFGPSQKRFIMGVELFEIMDISQEMHPAPLMQPLMDVVACVKVTAEYSLVLIPNQTFDHFSCSRMMILEIT